MGGDGDLGAGGGVFLFGYGIDVGSGWVNTRPRCFEGTEKPTFLNTVFYRVKINPPVLNCSGGFYLFL